VFAQLDQSVSVGTRRVEFPVRLFEITLKKRELFDRGTDGQAAQLNRAFKCPIAQAGDKGFGGRHNAIDKLGLLTAVTGPRPARCGAKW